MPRWTAWIYLPFNPVAWSLACAALLILAVLGTAPLRPGTLPPELTGSGLAVTIACSSLLNVILLWRHVRPRYLTGKTAGRAFAITFILLSSTLTLSAIAGTRLAVNAGWWQPAKALDVPGYAQSLAAGQLLLTAMLVFTALWPAPDSLDNVIAARQTIVSLLSDALKPDAAAEKSVLMGALNDLLRTQIVSWRAVEDKQLYGQWRHAAERLVEQIKPLASSDLKNQAKAELQQALNALN